MYETDLSPYGSQQGATSNLAPRQSPISPRAASQLSAPGLRLLPALTLWLLVSNLLLSAVQRWYVQDATEIEKMMFLHFQHSSWNKNTSPLKYITSTAFAPFAFQKYGYHSKY